MTRMLVTAALVMVAYLLLGATALMASLSVAEEYGAPVPALGWLASLGVFGTVAVVGAAWRLLGK